VGQRDRFEGYVEHGMFRPDDNLTEIAKRPFVVGRDYAEFTAMMSPAASRGTQASAALCSVIETAKANGHEQ
jgi:hypothetical protein